MDIDMDQERALVVKETVGRTERAPIAGKSYIRLASASWILHRGRFPLPSERYLVRPSIEGHI